MQTDELALALRTALRRLPGPLALVTARDPDDSAPAGMIASAVIPVSMDPPSMLVAINRSASLHRIIVSSGSFCINLLGVEQAGMIALFTDREARAQRFSSPDWCYAEGVPWLPSAVAAIFCTVDETLVFGTHELVVGKVHEVKSDPDSVNDPIGWIEGDVAQLGRLP